MQGCRATSDIRRTKFSRVRNFEINSAFLLFIADSNTERIGEQFEILSTGINSYKVATEYIDCRPILVLYHSNLKSVTVSLVFLSLRVAYSQSMYEKNYATFQHKRRSFATLAIPINKIKFFNSLSRMRVSGNSKIQIQKLLLLPNLNSRVTIINPPEPTSTYVRTRVHRYTNTNKHQRSSAHD